MIIFELTFLNYFFKLVPVVKTTTLNAMTGHQVDIALVLNGELG